MSDAIQVRDLISYLQTLDPEYRIKVCNQHPLRDPAEVFKREADHINLSPFDALQEDLRQGLETARDAIRDAIKKFEGLTLSEILEGADALHEDINDALDKFQDKYIDV